MPQGNMSVTRGIIQLWNHKKKGELLTRAPGDCPHLKLFGHRRLGLFQWPI